MARKFLCSSNRFETSSVVTSQVKSNVKKRAKTGSLFYLSKFIKLFHERSEFKLQLVRPAGDKLKLGL